MRNVILAAHATLAALWLGCILTEVIFERVLLRKGALGRTILAHLHVRVDKLIEIPAFAGVLLTGIAMFTHGHQSGLAFQTMLTAGIIAIATNVYCVWLVFQRRDAAAAEDWERFAALDHRQHNFGAIVLVCVLTALVAGYWAAV